MKIPTFFVPAAMEDTQEQEYATFAERCNRSVPHYKERIYSIIFIHDGDEWTATVGEKLHGIKERKTRGKQGWKYSQREVSDPAVILAIFPGNPFMVVTNHRIGGRDVGSSWVNPFMAGIPSSVVHFGGN